MILWLILAYGAGAVTVLLISIVLATREPDPPRCTAVLRSGEVCLGDPGHDGPHRARVYLNSAGDTQDYVWNDPDNGVCGVGFLRR